MFSHVHDGAQWLIRRCPACGGRCPPSKRAEQFTHISGWEFVRLRRLTSRTFTVEAALELFGQPDFVGWGQVTPVSTRGADSCHDRSYKMYYLTYYTLSESCHVMMGFGEDPRISRPGFMPKYIGPASEQQRLRTLLRPVRRQGDALRVFGAPDREFECSVFMQAEEGAAYPLWFSTLLNRFPFEVRRHLIYSSLSAKVDVDMVFTRAGDLHCVLFGGRGFMTPSQRTS